VGPPRRAAARQHAGLRAAARAPVVAPASRSPRALRNLYEGLRWAAAVLVGRRWPQPSILRLSLASSAPSSSLPVSASPPPGRQRSLARDALPQQRGAAGAACIPSPPLSLGRTAGGAAQAAGAPRQRAPRTCADALNYLGALPCAGNLPTARAQGEVLYNLAHPSSGHGLGGYMVTVVGAGFNTFSSDYRCQFSCGVSSLLSAAATP